MKSRIPPILLVIDNQPLCVHIKNELIQIGLLAIETMNLQDAQTMIDDASISCIVIMDYLSFSYDMQQPLLHCPTDLPKLTLIQPSRRAMDFFDHIRYPPYHLHEYLTLPIAKGDVTYKILKILDKTQ